MKVGEILVQYHLITKEQLKTALAEKDKAGMKLGEYLVSRGWIDEDIMIQVIGEALRVQTINLNEYRFSPEVLKVIPVELVKKYHIIPVRLSHPNYLDLAMDDPTNSKAIQEVEESTARKVRPLITSTSSILSAMELYYGISRRIPHAKEEERGVKVIEGGGIREEEEKRPLDSNLEKIEAKMNLCLLEVYKSLGPGFEIQQYLDALAIEMRNSGIVYERDVRLPIIYKKMRIGFYHADFLISGNTLVMVRNDREIDEDLLTVLRTRVILSGMLMGLLINFGLNRVEYRKVFPAD